MAKKQVIYTRQCSDGRACSGLRGDARAFVPDDVDVCDDCLASIYNLNPTYEGCCCGHDSEHTGYAKDDVLRVIRSGMQTVRYYIGMRVEWLDKHGNVDPNPRSGEYGQRTFVGIYDGSAPSPREPLEEWPWSGDSSAQAYRRLEELNAK